MQLKDKKVLVLGGGFEQLPLIKILKKENFFVILIDRDKNAVSKTYADKFYNFSIRDLKKIIKISKKNKIFAAMSICSDLAVQPLSKISKHLKIPGISLKSAIICTNKIFMKNHFKKNGIPTSKYHLFKDLKSTKKLISKMNFPIVMKPIDSYGQKGVFLIKNYKQLKTKINLSKKISKKKKILIEEFIDGTEINVVAIVKNYNVKILSMSRRFTYKNESFGIAYEHKYPLDMERKLVRAIKNLSIKTIKSIKIKDGVLYPQIIYNKNKGPHVVEIAARVPGGFMRDLSMLASGIDPIKFQIKCATGFKKQFANKKGDKSKKSVIVKFLSRKNFNFFNQKVYKRLEKVSKFKGIFKVHINKIKKLPKLNSSSGRFGAIIAFGKNISETNKYCNKAFNELKKK